MCSFHKHWKRAAAFGTTLVAAASLLACAPSLPPQSFNSPVFAVRAPAAGRPGYLETIRYIDDGIRYLDPASAFFVSPDGRMCFRGVLNIRRTAFEPNDTDWCLPPAAVSGIDTIRDPAIGAPELVLWCKHAAPQCVREIEFQRHPADTVTVPIVPPGQEKRAIEHLVYLMGGNLGDRHPFLLRAIMLDPPERLGGARGGYFSSP